jgi:DNA-binding transcriptional ArsR family regulator
MREGPDISRISSLIGDPARASMLTALMAGKALTASELAREAGVTVQTASSHLGKLERGGLLRLRKQGRHKYFGGGCGASSHAPGAEECGLARGTGLLQPSRRRHGHAPVRQHDGAAIPVAARG